MTDLSVQSLKVAIDGGEEEGLLVLHRDVLVAILVCLGEPTYGSDQGQWHLEIGFGECAARPMTFPKLEIALRWMADRLGVPAAEASVCAHHHLDRADGHADGRAGR